MAGSKTSNIFSLLSYSALATLMFLSILLNDVVPKAYAEEEAKCLTFLEDVPGSKDYCNGFLEPSSPSSPPPPPPSIQWGEDLEQCWSSLMSIQGCIGDIFFALLNGDFSKLEIDCCKAIELIAVECWLKMFPWNPMFPTTLIGSCKNIH